MRFLIICLLFLAAFSNESQHQSHPWPSKITELDEGIIVKHSFDTVYATVNTKDPDTHGKYQLQFTTTVSSQAGDILLKEFGAYFWKDNDWVFATIYNRPFNKDEFNKWYKGDKGYIKEGKSYSDADNWLTKTDRLTGDTITALFYFIGYNEQNEKVQGASEIVGIIDFK